MNRYRDPLTGLIDQGRPRGFITFQMVNAYLPDVGGSPRMVDDLVLALEDCGLDLVENPDLPRRILATLPAEKTLDGALPEEHVEVAEATPVIAPVFSRSGALYLRQMGKYPAPVA